MFLYVACLWICVFLIQFEPSFVCIFAFAYILKSKVFCGRAVRFGRALSGYPNTAQYFNVCVPTVVGLLSVWSHNNLKPKTKTTPSVCIYTVIKLLVSVSLHIKPKIKNQKHHNRSRWRGLVTTCRPHASIHTNTSTHTHTKKILWIVFSVYSLWSHQKLLGNGLSTPITPFSLICTICSKLSIILD